MPRILIESDTIAFTCYLVSTSEGNWGRGFTLADALKKAEAVTRFGKVKRGIKVFVSLNVQAEGNKLTPHLLATQPEFQPETDYKPGDYYRPHVDTAGGMHYRGQMIRIDLP